MDYDRLRRMVEVVAESSARLAEVVDVVADKAYNFIEYTEGYWQQAQPAVADAPVKKEPSPEEKIEYILQHLTNEAHTEWYIKRFAALLIEGEDTVDGWYRYYTSLNSYKQTQTQAQGSKQQQNTAKRRKRRRVREIS